MLLDLNQHGQWNVRLTVDVCTMREYVKEAMKTKYQFSSLKTLIGPNNNGAIRFTVSNSVRIVCGVVRWFPEAIGIHGKIECQATSRGVCGESRTVNWKTPNRSNFVANFKQTIEISRKTDDASPGSLRQFFSRWCRGIFFEHLVATGQHHGQGTRMGDCDVLSEG